jgi:hypothetical protein
MRPHDERFLPELACYRAAEVKLVFLNVGWDVLSTIADGNVGGGVGMASRFATLNRRNELGAVLARPVK